MKTVRGVALPDSDTHFAHMLAASPMIGGRATYQLAKIDAAMMVCPPSRRGLALDIGAHVGLWSNVLARRFDMVVAFEPVPAHIECFKANTADLKNIALYEECVGDEDGTIALATVADNSGRAHVDKSGPIKVACCKLDSLAFDTVDFIKVDVEGYELFVIRGAKETIQRDWPVIVVEQKPNNAEQYGLGRTDAVNLLCEWGYEIAWEMMGDYCLRRPC